MASRSAFTRLARLPGMLAIVALSACTLISGLDKNYKFEGGDPDGGDAEPGDSSLEPYANVCNLADVISRDSNCIGLVEGGDCCRYLRVCPGGSARCVAAFRDCQSVCNRDANLETCTRCLAGYSLAENAFVKCTAKYAGTCKSSSLESK